MKRLTLIILPLLLFNACKVDPEIAVTSKKEITEIIPAGWPTPHYTFSVNTLTEARFNLGRELFYDPILSLDNTISCGSCHQQATAFAHAEHKFSHGIHDLLGKRNAPALFNLNWLPSFMHDGGINHIEVQPLGPITNPIEMAESMPNVMAKLQASSKYKVLYKEAWGSDSMTSQGLFRAMAQFMGTMVSYNSKYDRYKRGETGAMLSEQELRGYNLFLAKCNACHTEPLFSDYAFRSNGLTVDPYLLDSGRAHITSLSTDRYKFKTPSLRNIAITQPYMHDGRYSTLQACLNHYTDNVKNQFNLDPILAPSGIPLTAEDKSDIIAFLFTLTDYQFITDEKFAEPHH